LLAYVALSLKQYHIAGTGKAKEAGEGCKAD
jgi:hypothetical protein